MAVNRDALWDELVELIRQHGTSAEAKLSRDTKIQELGVDSIDMMEIVFRLEETHGIDVSISGLADKDTIGDVFDYVFEQIAG